MSAGTEDRDASEYRGDVVVGGEPQVRLAGCLRITKIAVDPEMSNNAYLLHCTRTGDQVLVDAAADAPTLLALAGDAGLRTVVTTHQHWDHHRALAEVVAATGAEVVVGAPDAEAVTGQTGVEVTRAVGHGDTLAVGACRLEVIALAGHTPGSWRCSSTPPTSATAARTCSPATRCSPAGWAARSATRRPSCGCSTRCETKIFDRLGDDTWFYPGHGDDSTLGEQRPHLAQWRERGW